MEYQRFCTKPSEQGLFFQAGQNEFKEWYATTKTYKNIKYLSEDEFPVTFNVNYILEDLLPVMVTSHFIFLNKSW